MPEILPVDERVGKLIHRYDAQWSCVQWEALPPGGRLKFIEVAARVREFLRDEPDQHD